MAKKKAPAKQPLGPRARQDLLTIQDARQLNPTPPARLEPELPRLRAMPPASQPSPIGPSAAIAGPSPSNPAAAPRATPRPEGLRGLQCGLTGLAQYYGALRQEFRPDLQHEP